MHVCDNQTGPVGFEKMSKLKKGTFLASIICLFLLAGCGAPSGGDSGDDSAFVTVVPVGNGKALVSWMPPTENTDGSPLLDLAGYRIYYGINSGIYSKTVDIDNPGLTSFLVEDLGVSDWFFAMTAYNAFGAESGYSAEVAFTVN